MGDGPFPIDSWEPGSEVRGAARQVGEPAPVPERFPKAETRMAPDRIFPGQRPSWGCPRGDTHQIPMLTVRGTFAVAASSVRTRLLMWAGVPARSRADAALSAAPGSIRALAVREGAPVTVEALPWWADGMTNLRALYDKQGVQAHERADAHGRVYSGRRAVMVFDVVASRQRRYDQRVKPLVERFAATASAVSLGALTTRGPGDGYGLRSGEAETMQQVAAGLVRYMEQHELDEETAVGRWATEATPFEHAPKLEPYVGSVRGMGPALLAYLRMRCGADAVKPDLRVRDGLNRLGFQVPSDVHAILVVAHAAADALDVPRLVLDQLLWWPATESG